MPKRRSVASVAGTGGGTGDVAEMESAQDNIDLTETPITEPESEPVNTSFIPVYSPGVENRLDRPLSVADGETNNWRILWDTFTYSDDLAAMSPEDLGNLYEYSTGD